MSISWKCNNKWSYQRRFW